MKLFLWFIIVVAIAGGVWWYAAGIPSTTEQHVVTPNQVVTYLCEGGLSVNAGFANGIVQIRLSDSREFTLEQVQAASGAKFANEGEQIVFWTKDYGAFVQEDGEMTYRDCVVQMPGTTQYSNPTYGVSFAYPDAYELTEREVGNGQRRHYAITLTRKADLPPPQGGEGPPTISFDIDQNDIDGISLDEWLKGTNFSNFKLSDGTFASTTVDGTPAVRYHWSGLYEANTVAFGHRDNIIAVSGMYLAQTDPIVADFEEVMASIKLD